MKERILALLLCISMMCSMVPTPAFAADTVAECTHHTEHTDDCGYVEAVAGVPCGHEHSESCYSEEISCTHIHGDCGYAEAVEAQECTTCQSVLTHVENCGYVAPVAEVACTCTSAEDGTHAEDCAYEPAVEEQKCQCVATVTHGGEGCTYVEGKDASPCIHICSVETGCYKLLCSHAQPDTHDAACGYIAASEGTPCAYVCSECAVSTVDEEATDNCPYCEETTAEDGTATHTENCNAAYAYDGTADVGKYMQVINDDYGIAVCADGAITEDDSMAFYYDEFTEGTIMRIEGWYWGSETASIWYQVSFYSGGLVEASAEDWPETAWVLYDYSDPSYEYDPGLAFLSTCDVCGKPDCNEEHTAESVRVYCTVCEAYDCGLTHLYCRACREPDCAEEHIWCGTCGGYDCGITHETYTPIVAPVIPEDPTLTEGEVVSIVDEYGEPVTAADGFILAVGTKASLSAWSDLENASYQWQICYDVENDLWADIQGQNGKGILVSPAMVESIITDAQTCAPIRCVVTSGESTETSAAIPVTIMEQTSVFSTRAGAALLTDTGDSESSEQSDEDTTIYTVTIEYKYSYASQFEGQLVSQAYIAEFPAGSTPGNDPVISPNCIGYTPDRAQVDLSTLGAIISNRTITVCYSPAEVSYTVRHYQQNIDDDEYTWEDTTLATGLTEQLTSEAAKNNNPAKDYEGFTALPHYAEKIAADSSTTIDIYYDRNYYLMSFDLNGGYGVEAIYARYGASISVGTPIKAGYSFEGWTRNDSEASIPGTMPPENRSYTALWSPGNTTYTIAYWLENPDTSDVYDFVGSVAASANSGSIVSGNNNAVDNGIFTADEVKYYTFNADKTDTSVTIAGDGSTVVNVYYDRNEYTLKFYFARLEGTTYDIADDTKGSSNNGGTAASASWVGNFTTKPTLDSKYTELSETINGNTYYYFTITAKYGASLNDLWPNAPLSAAGSYNFISWGTHYGSGYYNANSNKNIKGVYSVMDSRLLIDPTVTADKGVNHWMVGYWNTDPTMYIYEIYYSLLAGEEADRTYNSVGYKKVAQYTVGSTDTPSGQSALPFEGVYNIGKDYDNNTQVDGAIVRFYYQRYTHTVTLDDGYGNLKKYENIPYGDTLGAYLTGNLDPQYPDELPNGAYEFDGWYQSKEGIGALDTSVTMPNEDLIYYAKWNPVVYTVTVNDGNGTELSTEQVNYGSKATKPTDPTMDNATFIGWYYLDAQGEEQRFDFDNMTITHDVTIYAKWRSNVMKQVTVRYLLEDVTPVADPEVMMLRVGATRTFEAKTGNSLYEDYRTGTFPTTSTTSITPTADDEELLVTFYYKQYEAVAYNVEFYVQLDVDEDNDGVKDLRSAFWTVDGEVKFIGYSEDIPTGATAYVEYNEAHPDNDKAIVTELYTPEVMSNVGWSLPDKYVPNALRIQRVIVPGEDNAYNDENTIVFIYTYDPDAALYSVNHYIQYSDGTNTYSLYSHKEYAGNIGAVVADVPISIPGYTFSSQATSTNKQSGTTLGTDGKTLSGTVNIQDSLELNFYYTVNQYPYQIMYLEKGTNRVLMDAKTTNADGNLLKGNYGSQVIYTLETDAEKALLEDYEVDATSKSIYIQMEAGDTASVNTIIFYYTRKSADLIVSKTVALDAEQAEQEGVDDLPDSALTQDFTYTITYPKGFYKSVYDCTITDADGNSTDSTVIAQTTTMTFTLKHGQTIQIKDLDMGTYTVTETYVPGFRITVNGNTAAQQREDVSITAELVTANQNVTVDFVNSYPFFTGELVLGKKVTKADSTDPNASGSYKVTVTLTPYEDTREVDRIIKWTEGTDEKTYTVPALTDADTTKTFTFYVMVPVDGTVTLSGVPAGTFTAEETPRGDVGLITDYYEVTTYSELHNNEETVVGSGPEVTGVIHGGHLTTVTFGNTYKKGNLTINKTVAQEYKDDSFAEGTFTFAITGTTELPVGAYYATIGTETKEVTVDASGNVTMADVTVTVTKPEDSTDTTWSNSLTIGNLPAGYYTVTEKADEAYTIGSVNPVSNLLVNNTENPTEANFSNTFKRTTGNLKISKEIVIIPGSNETINVDQQFTFTVTLNDGTISGSYECVYMNADGNTISDMPTSVSVVDSKITLTLQHNQSVLIKNLPVGNYTVKETYHEGYDSSFREMADSTDTYEPVRITSANTEDNPATASCTNRYPVYYGDLEIQKHVTNENSFSEAPADAVFTFTISGDSGLDGLYDYTRYSGSADTTGTTGTVTMTGKQFTVTLKADERIVIRDLPVGTYNVVEQDVSIDYNISWNVNGNTAGIGTTANATIAPGDNDVVAFTNEYKNHLATLTISKSGAQDIDENQSFIFEVTGPNGYSQTVVIHGTDSVAIKDLPAGEYTVTEKTDWSWRYGPENSSKNVTLEEMQTSTVSFVNTRDLIYWLGGDNWVVNTFDTINNIISKKEGEDVSAENTSD